MTSNFYQFILPHQSEKKLRILYFFIFQKYITSLFEVCHHRNVHSPYETKPISGNLIFLITYKKQCILVLLIVWN